MRDYEILYIIRPELDDEQVTEATGKVGSLIQSLGGNPVQTNLWGKRRLAYEVKHLREGHYVLTDFALEPGRIPEMEATLRISDTVFRHLIVQKPYVAPARGAEAVAPVEAAAPLDAEVPAAGEAPAEAASEAGPEPVAEAGVEAVKEEKSP